MTIRKVIILIMLTIPILTACTATPAPLQEPLPEPTSEHAPTATVTPIPFHETIPLLQNLTATAAGQPLQIANVPINTRRSWVTPPIPDRHISPSGVVMFDMAGGAVEISVTRPAGVTSAIVRPARANITPAISGDTVTFTITRYGQYTLEFDGNPLVDCLHIFANPAFTPTPGARIINDAHHGPLHVQEGETVALMPGAVVHGGITMGSNSRLEGRGVIWGPGPTNFTPDADIIRTAANAVRVWGQDNITVDGIAAFNQSRWVMEFRNSTNVTVNNVKIISAGNNGDGITIQSSRDVLVKNSFVRSWDDAIVVKNYSPIDSANQHFKNLVLWADLAQPIEIGYETNAGNESWFGGQFNRDAQIYNIVFEDIDIIHAMHQSVLSIHNDNRALVRDIVFRNIIVDNVELEARDFRYLIDFRNHGMPHSFQGYRNCDGQHWAIDNITVDGVWVMGGNRNRAGWVFDDMDGVRPITNVNIRNIFWVPGEEPLWPDMDGALPGVSYTASPFVPPPLDYTSWHRDNLFKDMTVEEISEAAMAYCDNIVPV